MGRKPRVLPRRGFVEANGVVALEGALAGLVLVIRRAVNGIREGEGAIRPPFLGEAFEPVTRDFRVPDIAVELRVSR